MTNKSTLILVIATLPLFFFLSSCGGGGGDSLPSAAPAPAVASITPTNLSQSVGLNEPVVVKFNQSVADANLNGAKVTISVISEFGDIVTGSTVYDETSQTATFVPDPYTPLAVISPSYAIHAKYNIVVTLADSGGQTVANYQGSFTTKDGVWGVPTILENTTLPNSAVYGAQLSMNKDGKAFAYWEKQGKLLSSDATAGAYYFNYDFMVNFYNLSLGWGNAPFKIDSDDSGSIARKKLVLSNSGKAVAVWLSGETGSSSTRVWTNYFNPPNNWNGDAVGKALAKSLTKDEFVNGAVVQTFIYHDNVAIDNSGNAIALWDQSYPRGIFVNRFDATSTPPDWEPASTELNLKVVNTARAANAKIVFDDKDNGIAVWLFTDTSQTPVVNSVLAVYYDSQRKIGWVTNNTGVLAPTKLNLVSLNGTTLGTALEPDIAINKRGDAVVVFAQSDRVSNSQNNIDIWVQHYTNGSGWLLAPIRIENENGKCSSPKVAVSESGSAIVVWKCLSGIYANVFRPDVGWQRNSTKISANEVVPGVAGITELGGVAIDRKGNAFVIWEHKEAFNTLGRIHSAHYIAGQGWESYANNSIQLPLDMNDTAFYSKPKVIIDRNGNATFVVAKYKKSPRLEVLVFNRYIYNKGWNMSGSIGNSSILEENPERYQYIGDSGLSDLGVDEIGRVIILGLNTDYVNNNTPGVNDRKYLLRAYNFK